MSKRGNQKAAPRRRGWVRRRVALSVGAILLTLAGGALWLRPGHQAAQAGTPRLMVDRTEVDLGYRRFDAPVRVVFTLTNAGDAPLRLTEVPPVRAVAGC